MSRITTFKDKIPKNSILARIFCLRQGYKDKSCPGQDFRETRTRWHPWFHLMMAECVKRFIWTKNAVPANHSNSQVFDHCLEWPEERRCMSCLRDSHGMRSHDSFCRWTLNTHLWKLSKTREYTTQKMTQSFISPTFGLCRFWVTVFPGQRNKKTKRLGR